MQLKRIPAGFFEFQLVKIDHDVQGSKLAIGVFRDLHFSFDRFDHFLAVTIDEAQPKIMLPGFAGAEPQPACYGTRGMSDRELLGVDGVECSYNSQFRLVVLREIREGKNF